jgi:hypothetical protein
MFLIPRAGLTKMLNLQTRRKKFFAWRRDPQKSFSDWTIRVIQSSDDINDDNNDATEKNNCSQVRSRERRR